MLVTEDTNEEEEFEDGPLVETQHGTVMGTYREDEQGMVYKYIFPEFYNMYYNEF